MARVTIERALAQCESRFELVVLLSYRAHAIASGVHSVVNADNKFAVLALRELEAGKIDIKELREILIKRYAIELQSNISNNSFLLSDRSTNIDNDDFNNIRNKASIEGKGSGVKLNVALDFFASSDDENQ